MIVSVDFGNMHPGFVQGWNLDPSILSSVCQHTLAACPQILGVFWYKNTQTLSKSGVLVVKEIVVLCRWGITVKFSCTNRVDDVN